MFKRLIDRLKALLPKPGMIGTPPSARQIPADPGLHAVDFSHRYFEPMDYHASQRMTELGIPTDQIGSSVPVHGIRHATFIPYEKTGGGNGPGGRLVVDSGVFNPDLHADLGSEVSSYWILDTGCEIVDREHYRVVAPADLQGLHQWETAMARIETGEPVDDNPYRAPQTRDSNSTDDVRATALGGTLKLYSPWQVGLATFLFSPIAGFWLLASNYRSLGKRLASALLKTLLYGGIATALFITRGVHDPQYFSDSLDWLSQHVGCL